MLAGRSLTLPPERGLQPASTSKPPLTHDPANLAGIRLLKRRERRAPTGLQSLAVSTCALLSLLAVLPPAAAQSARFLPPRRPVPCRHHRVPARWHHRVDQPDCQRHLHRPNRLRPARRHQLDRYVKLLVTNRLSTNQIVCFNPPPGMAYIPAGTFTMGDTTDGGGDASPVYNVYVSAFFMDVNLVTHSQWQGIYNWATNHGYGFDNPGAGKAADHPVQSVNWYDAVKWCNARLQQAGLPPVYYQNAGLTQIFIRRGTLWRSYV